MEGILLFGEIVFGMMICAMFFPSALSYIEEISGAVELFIFAAFCFNYILLESLHVCMGFGLYINSRVEVEGWDMQLLFQKFSSPRGASLKAAQSKKTIPAALLFLALFSTPAAVHAQTGYDLDYEYSLPRENSSPVEYFPQDFPQLSESSFEDLKEILSSKDFGSEEESWGIRLKKRDTERRPPAFTPGPWFNTIRQLFGFLLRFLAVLAVAGILGFGVYWYVKHRGVLFRGKKAGGRSYVNPLLVRESPEALFAKAGDFFARGFVREAWAACLAGCLGVYAGNYSLSFPGDATEYGCLALVQKTLPGKAGKFREVVQDWVLFAYGGRPPAEGAFERALDWGRALGTPGQTARNGSSGETP